jgi:glutamate dehydrogenase (NAD(P)+)
MLDEYETMMGRHLPGTITGKPTSLFGSLGRGDATATAHLHRSKQHALGLNLTRPR